MAERAAAPRPARRLRGAGLGPARQPLAAGLGYRAAGRPSRARPDPRQLPHPSRRRRPRRPRRRAGRKTVLPAACRCAEAVDGRAVLEPPLPHLPRPGRAAGRRPSCATCSRAGYRGPLSLEIFNDEFRAAPARRIARDGAAQPDPADDEAAAGRPPASPPPRCPPRARRLRVPRIRRRRRVARAARRPARHPRLPPRRPAPLQIGRAAAPGRRQPRAEQRTRQRGVRALRDVRPTVCAMALRVDDPARALPRAESLLSPAWQERIGEGERASPPSAPPTAR